MKKIAKKTLNEFQQAKNVKVLPKVDLRKVKGGIVIDDINGL